MKRWKKVALVVLAALVLSQTPFMYRRYRLGRLNAAIQSLNAQRTTDPPGETHADYRGVVHVHSLLGGHSTGGFDEIVEAAKANGLAFVVMTEHPAKHIDTAAATLHGVRDGVLFVGGSETNPAHEDRLLIMPGMTPAVAAAQLSTPDMLAAAKRDGRLVFVAYPEQIRSWELEGFDGIEIYNLYTNTKRINYGLLFFDGLWSYWSYPHLLFTRFYERPADNLKKWDELMTTRGRRLVAIAGNDAHANVGLSVQDLTGEPLLRIRLDPYERSFRVVRTHVLLEKSLSLNAGTLSSALADGHCYIAFDLFGDATGFRFVAENGTDKKIMGDEINLADGVRLRVSVPIPARIVVFRDGAPFHESNATPSTELVVNRRGVYRVEAYLDQLGASFRDNPWIISNPVYVK